MQGIIKTKSFKLVSLLLVAAICVTALVWNPLKAHAVEIDGTNVQSFGLLSSSSSNTTPITSGSFGMFFTTDGNDDTRFNASNMKWTYANGNWESNTKLLWANSTATATVHAYYPYSETATDMKAIPWSVKADQSTAENITASDILRYSGTASYDPENTGENVGLNIGFTHAGSKLVIDLSDFGTEITNTNATVKSVKLSGAKLDGTLDLTKTTDAWTLGETTGNVTMKYVEDATANTKTAECIIIPQTIAKLTVTVTMDDGAVYQFNAENVTVASGNEYTMAVQIGQDVINMGTIGIKPWDSVEVTENLETN